MQLGLFTRTSFGLTVNHQEFNNISTCWYKSLIQLGFYFKHRLNKNGQVRFITGTAQMAAIYFSSE